MRRLRPAFLGLLAVAALAGCGGGEDEATTPGQPAAEHPLSQQVPVFERAVDELRCEDAVQVIHVALLPNAEDPSDPSNCKDALYPLRQERGVVVAASDEFGTGAVVDTRLHGDEESLVWALDPSGDFKWTGAFVRASQVGSEAGDAREFDQVAEDFVAALRDGDCGAAYAQIDKGSRLDYGDEATFCDKFADTFEGEGGLASRLEGDPEAEPVGLGATADLAFYGISTDPAGYRTLIVGRTDPAHAPRVIETAPTER